jgi:hypothetical protein
VPDYPIDSIGYICIGFGSSHVGSTHIHCDDRFKTHDRAMKRGSIFETG